MSKFLTDPDSVLRIPKLTLDSMVKNAKEIGFYAAVEALKAKEAYLFNEEVDSDMTPFSWAEWVESRKEELLK
jgi:hypothetical protein